MSKTKFDKEFAVGTINRTRDAIAAIYIISKTSNSQAQYINAVSNVQSVPTNDTQKANNSELLFA